MIFEGNFSLNILVVLYFHIENFLFATGYGSGISSLWK